ncbi:MAG: terminase small subunit [Syntrophothermus sp.]
MSIKRAFTNAEKLRTDIKEYFNKCDSRTKPVIKDGGLIDIPFPAPYTISGIANHLKVNETTLNDYCNGNYDNNDNMFSEVIIMAKQKCLEDLETRAIEKYTSGIPMILKNRFKWSDKHEIETNQKDDYSNMTHDELVQRAEELVNKIKGNK